MMADLKVIATIFIGCWTFVMVCIVLTMYSTWQENIIKNGASGNRGELGTTEPLGLYYIFFKLINNLFVHFFP